MKIFENEKNSNKQNSGIDICKCPLLSAAVLFFSMESSVPGGSLLNASSGGANKVKGPPSAI